MFDVRPVSKNGDLDWQKIEKIEKIVRISHKHYFEKPIRPLFAEELPIKKEKKEDIDAGLNYCKQKKSFTPTPEYSMSEHESEQLQAQNVLTQCPEREPVAWGFIESRPKTVSRAKKRKAEIFQMNRTFGSDELPICHEVELSQELLEKIRGPRGVICDIKTVRNTERIKYEPPKEYIEIERNYLEPAPILQERKKPEVNSQKTCLPAGRGGVSLPVNAPAYLPRLKSKRSAEIEPKVSPGANTINSDNEFYDYDKDEIKSIGDNFKFLDLFLPIRYSLSFNFGKIKKSLYLFSGVAAVILFFLISIPLIQKGLNLREQVLGESTQGYQDLEKGLENVKAMNFESSTLNFSEAYAKFSDVSDGFGQFGESISSITRYIPVASKFSSARYANEAGKHIALAGKSFAQVAENLSSLGNPLNSKGDSQISLLDVFLSTKSNLKTAKDEIQLAVQNIDKINIDDLPEDKKNKFLEVKQKMPQVLLLTESFLDNSGIFIDLLGGNGPRKYLFLFQNNQEMRPTGGFIGSYGLLDIKNGHVRKFFIDGIFNPDGQLREKIVPPTPIQKISAAWSLHDSNWWPDFPTSAKKAISFYEKTGGPTVDGIITITPTVMQKLLEITGPMEMEEYDVTLDSENFIEKTQYEVEIDYDKEENQPKKILADLAPQVLEKIFNAKDVTSVSRVLNVLSTSLGQKQILLYSENSDLQKIISQEGWSGEILDSEKDYLSVINTNINGYKSDGIIEENIEHRAEIQEDGSIIDNLTITRKHNGGNSDYSWWNKVNADYLRVYVPEGSKLLEVSGQTREFNDPPLDYDALSFKRDPDVESEEKNMDIDRETGTRTYKEKGKTVFANWAYVSPQETVVIRYRYLLPFKIFSSEDKKTTDSYSLLVQKQSGSIGSQFVSEINYPNFYKLEWNYPNIVQNSANRIKIEDRMDSDKFFGFVFARGNFIKN